MSTPESGILADFDAQGGARRDAFAAAGVLAMKAGRVTFPNFAYAVFDRAGGDAAVIDPGWAGQDLLAALGRAGLRVRAVLLTHSHTDHTACAEAIAAEAGCPVHMAAAEVAESGATFSGLVPLRGDETLRFGRLEIQVIPTPGHTAGSLCFLAQDALFTGDTLFIEGCGLAKTSYGAGNAGALFDSLERLRAQVPGTTRVFPGHRFRMPLGARLSEMEGFNFYLRLRNRESFVRFCERPARAGSEPPPIGSVPLMVADFAFLPGAEPDGRRACA